MQRTAYGRDVLITRCVVLQGHAISIGSEMSGGVYNVTVSDVTFDGRATRGYGAGSLRVKSARGRGVCRRRPPHAEAVVAA